MKKNNNQGHPEDEKMLKRKLFLLYLRSAAVDSKTIFSDFRFSYTIFAFVSHITNVSTRALPKMQ